MKFERGEIEMNTTLNQPIENQTRFAAYMDITPKKKIRRSLIFDVLANSAEGLTSEEITERLLHQGQIKYFDMNFVRPRITEMKRAGIISSIGKRRSKRTGKNIAVWVILHEKEKK